MIGGFVVRDPGLPTLAGRYLFGDLAKPTAFSAALGTAPSPRPEPGLPRSSTRSFGEDGCGRIYVAIARATVSRVQPRRRVSHLRAAGLARPVPPPARRRPPPGGRTRRGRRDAAPA